MIFDTLDNAARYGHISPLLAKGLASVAEIAAKPPGRYEIDGDDLYVMVQEYRTKELADSVWEAHHKYIDVHCVISGAEADGYCSDASKLEVTSPYEDGRDAELFKASIDADGKVCADGDFLTCTPGTFVVFFEYEPHMPCVAIGDPSDVRKVVVKIKA